MIRKFDNAEQLKEWFSFAHTIGMMQDADWVVQAVMHKFSSDPELLAGAIELLRKVKQFEREVENGDWPDGDQTEEMQRDYEEQGLALLDRLKYPVYVNVNLMDTPDGVVLASDYWQAHEVEYRGEEDLKKLKEVKENVRKFNADSRKLT